ncbi:troponin T, fast skeletal muscle-like [Penaeus indicus]|uniref:troponin T, fast skeletal muscle-like n=1 Tax=Penaeus indicus TaxID=29960 RepID=UPI00300C3C07
MSDEETQYAESENNEEEEEEEEEGEVDEIFEKIEEAKDDNVEKILYDEEGNPVSFTFNKVFLFGERGSGLRPRGEVQDLRQQCLLIPTNFLPISANFNQFPPI